jgi:hypothetical protein
MHRAEISLSCNQLYYLETIGVMVMVFNAGRDRMLVGFITTYAISAYHH